jgi:hypothetical protein
MSSYNKFKSASKSTDDHFKTTAARLQQIQSQLENTPGVGKLKNKVCVVTGVNSLKGIGYVCQ